MEWARRRRSMALTYKYKMLKVKGTFIRTFKVLAVHADDAVRIYTFIHFIISKGLYIDLGGAYYRL